MQLEVSVMCLLDGIMGSEKPPEAVSEVANFKIFLEEGREGWSKGP